jgi:hypothetical protein
MTQWLFAFLAAALTFLSVGLSADRPGSVSAAWQSSEPAHTQLAELIDSASPATNAPIDPDWVDGMDASTLAEGEHDLPALLSLNEPAVTATFTAAAPLGHPPLALSAPCLAGPLRPPRA